jgi:NAD(P)-dependent dehydrogenase (short-subunit alcohol dehydrogenase family)
VQATEDRFGSIDALMTNSGQAARGLALRSTIAWQDAADLLLFSALRMIRPQCPRAARRRCDLMSTSSSVKSRSRTRLH